MCRVQGSGFTYRIRVQGARFKPLRGSFCKSYAYPLSGKAVKCDRQEVLGRSFGPTVGRISQLATGWRAINLFPAPKALLSQAATAAADAHCCARVCECVSVRAIFVSRSPLTFFLPRRQSNKVDRLSASGGAGVSSVSCQETLVAAMPREP